MKRDLDNIASQNFDVLVIGGGIHGAAIARETALAGLKTALIEKKDFSHATSSNSLKIIHGGLRYLQHLNIKRMRESIKSRRAMMRFAPHLVKPLACIMPTYGHGLKGREIMRVALFVNDIISHDRNCSLDPEVHLPAGKIISQEMCLKMIPEISRERLNGAGLWYDAIAINTERLSLSFIHEAADNGACIANYLETIDLNIQNKQIKGILAHDIITGKQFEIKSKIVVNVAGPWLDKILSFLSGQNKEPQLWARGINIIVRKKMFSDIAVGLEGRQTYIDNDAVLKKGNRLYFFVPWRGYTMIGTEYKHYQGNPDNFKIELDDIIEFIEEINTIYPPAKLSLGDVTFFHAGLLPMSKSSKIVESDVQLEKNSKLIDHEKTDSIRGLISVKGVKYTTAPQTASDVKNLISRYINLAVQATPLPKRRSDNNITDQVCKKTISGNNLTNMDKIVRHLKFNYGHQHKRILQFAVKTSCSSDWISNDPPVTVMEILYSIRKEMALSLSDIIFRRTVLGTAECPSKKIIDCVADITAKELNWSSANKLKQIKDVYKHYLPLKVINNNRLGLNLV
ncbi:MAG: glycerol-3-phosphate dehydrogenase/oxidase [Deltaproteobacteria bacterium]|nr:glycerol-3-phosphate dehydrogenase/oxidase [Deltaproteobacteria bacterium]